MLNWNLYVVIDRGIVGDNDLSEVARLAISGGADVIQLRDKTSSTKSLLRSAYSLRVLTLRANIPFIIDDRVDVAIAAEADGVHLGDEDLPIRTARKLLGKEKIIGRSTHSLKEALIAQSEGADYISTGPIFQSPLKANLAARGIGLVTEVAHNIVIPFVSIGGINEGNVEEVLKAGAEIIAVVRAVVGSGNISGAARRLKERIRKHKEGLGR